MSEEKKNEMFELSDDQVEQIAGGDGGAHTDVGKNPRVKECPLCGKDSSYYISKTGVTRKGSWLGWIDDEQYFCKNCKSIGKKYKVKHRADFGISVLKEYWGLGLGKTLTEACIQCARDAGYDQVELNVVAENERAISLYRDFGFVEYGRNPRGFKSKMTGYQELVYMLLEL